MDYQRLSLNAEKGISYDLEQNLSVSDVELGYGDIGTAVPLNPKGQVCMYTSDWGVVLATKADVGHRMRKMYYISSDKDPGEMNSFLQWWMIDKPSCCSIHTLSELQWLID